MELLKFLFAVLAGFSLSVVVLVALPMPVSALALFGVASVIIRMLS